MSFTKSIKLAAGSFLGSGHLPKAPGTWGSLFFLPVIYTASVLGPSWILWAILAITIFLSLWSADACIKIYGDDPPSFVMDECAGQTIPFLFTAFTSDPAHDLPLLLAGFVFFRFFDILKPLGIDALQHLPGKFGILADDLLAGLYALFILEGLMFFLLAA